MADSWAGWCPCTKPSRRVCRISHASRVCDAHPIDTAQRASLWLTRRFPLGIKWECGEGVVSPEPAAAPATVSGESFVIFATGWLIREGDEG